MGSETSLVESEKIGCVLRCIDKINLLKNIIKKINTVTDYISSTQNFTEVFCLNYLFDFKAAISII